MVLEGSGIPRPDFLLYVRHADMACPCPATRVQLRTSDLGEEGDGAITVTSRNRTVGRNTS